MAICHFFLPRLCISLPSLSFLRRFVFSGDSGRTIFDPPSRSLAFSCFDLDREKCVVFFSTQKSFGLLAFFF